MSRQNPQAIGHAKEQQARAYLEAQGLQQIVNNYRCRFGEIDLIMREGDTLVFVEVRFRSSDRFGTSAETVGLRKQRRLIAAAEHYLQRHPSCMRCRFDVLALGPGEQMQWIQNAFEAGGSRCS